MTFLKTKELMAEEISDGINDFHKINGHKRIEIASSYIEERNEYGRDPVIDLDRGNSLMLRSFLDVNNEVKLNQLKEELTHAIIQENICELEDMFEQEFSNFNDREYREAYYEI